jgi:hypothetical protein
MCRWRDSVAAQDAAAEQLAITCEARLRGVPIEAIDPVRAGVSRSIRKAFRDLSLTSPDMALTLRKMK